MQQTTWCLWLVGELALLASAVGTAGQEPAGPATKLSDLHGDPLPAGAVARLGTTRLRVGGYVWALDFSPDGKHLASGSIDNTVRVWDVATGKEARRLGGHDPWVTSVVYAPDGSAVASAGADGMIRVSDPATGKVLRHFKGHGEPVSCLAFSPDGTLLASGSGVVSGGDSTLRLWEAKTGNLLREFQHRDQVRAVAFAPDGKSFASAGNEGLVRVWESNTLRLRTEFRTHGQHVAVVRLAFAADGRTLAVAGDHRGPEIVLWDMVAGKPLHRLDGRAPLAFAPNGKILATAGRGSGAYLWDPVTGKEVRRLGPAVRDVTAVAFTRDGKTLAAGNAATIHLWQVEDGKALHAANGHLDGVTAVAFSPDGKQVASGSFDGTARLWDAATGKHLRQLADHPAGVVSLAFAGKGQQLVSAGVNFRIAEVAGGKEAKPLATGQDTRPVRLSGDGQTAVTECSKGWIQCWDTTTGKEKARLVVKPSGQVLAISHDGKLLAFQARDEADPAIRMWDVAAKKVLRTLDVETDDETGIRLAAFSPDGKTLALVQEVSRVVSLWDVATGKEIRRLPPAANQVFSLAFSPNGTLIAVGNWDNSVRVYSTATGKETAHLVGHQGHVNALAFSPDGKRLASASSDGTVLIWAV
jgi:WD40 repeat protein